MRLPPRDPDKPLACDESTWLPSEASERRYARLRGLHHYVLDTAIVMLFPQGTAAAEVERVARATQLLHEAGVPVPRIHDTDAERRWILQEDLGARSLAEAAAEGEPIAEAYAEALSLLPRIVAAGTLETSPRPPLDGERMLRELELFVESALSLDGPAGPGLRRDLEALVEHCLGARTVLCHRDYHARNLMLHEGRVRVIDHQDAMPGPEPYDRVSLAYDPYVPLDDALRDALAGDAPATEAVAVQRLVKAIGTYASKGQAWAQHIAPAARQARRLIGRGELRLPVLDAALAPLAVEAGPRP